METTTTTGVRAATAVRTLPPRTAPLWRWHPALVAASILTLDFGILLVIRIVEHGAFFVPWDNRTFVIGDSICLPLYAGFVAIVLRSSRSSYRGFYTRVGWHVAVVGAALIFAVGLDLIAVGAGKTSVFESWRPSKTYHLVVSAVMFYLLVSVLPAALHARRPLWAAALAMLSLGVYLAIATTQIQPMARESMVRMARFVEAYESTVPRTEEPPPGWPSAV